MFKFRIYPNSFQLCSTNILSYRTIIDIYSCTIIWTSMSYRIRLETVRTYNIKYFFFRSTAINIDPTFNNLNSLKRSTIFIFLCPDNEFRNFIFVL